jgi:predicted permease
MRLIVKARSLFRNLLLSRHADADLDQEICSHIDLLMDENIRAGMPPDEALRAARIEVGNAERVKEQVREVRAGVWLQSVISDCRFAMRGLLRNPIFALTAIVSLSLAIGANAAIYSVLDAALWRPLPVSQPDQLFTLTTPETDQPGVPLSHAGDSFSYPLFEQLRRGAGDSARIALFDTPNRVQAQASGTDGPYEEATQQFVSPDSFDMLGVPPATGRLLSTREDFYPSPRAVVVLSYDYWRHRFNADPSAVGRKLILDGRTYSILGVARQGFSGTEPGKFVDVWLPITLADPAIFTNPSLRLFHLMGRLAPGISREKLLARLHPVFRQYQATTAPLRVDLPPAVQQQLKDMNLLARSAANGIAAPPQTLSQGLWILFGVAVCMLLIACANVASLLLARSRVRSAEMALRVSLGAQKARLVRQLLTESLLISLLASLGGWALAGPAAHALMSMVSTNVNTLRLDLSLDARMVLFCAFICTFSGLCFGLLPAWQASATGPMAALRHPGSATGSRRLGRLFVGAQIGFTFCLVTGGVAFLFSLRNLAAVHTGFDPRGVTVLTVSNTLQQDRQLEVMQQIEMHVAAQPNVEGAATAWMAIFSGARRAQRIIVPGHGPSDQEETFYRVSPGYFATLRTPLLSGRDFTFSDNDNEPVPTVVNRTFARRYLGGESAVGRKFRRDDGVLHQVVGVAADSHFGDLRNGPEAIVYMPMKPPRTFTLYVRSTLDAGSVSKIVDREAIALGSGVRVRDVTTLEALVESTIRNERLVAGIGGAFALLGLILAAVGVFGILNYSVTLQTKEFGIRIALGAQRLTIYKLVLKELIGTITGGVALGLTGSLMFIGFARSLMFGIGSVDPLVIGTAMSVLVGTAMIAAGLPAHRAASVDPVEALRAE